MMDRAWVGLIGTGFMGNLHVTSLYETRNVELVAVASKTLSKAAQFAKAHHVAHTYEDYRQLLDPTYVDKGIVSVPNFLHEELVVGVSAADKDNQPFKLNLYDLPPLPGYREGWWTS